MADPGDRDDTDTAEEGVGPRDPEDAWEIGAGMEPDDYAEGEAMTQEAEEAGELRKP